VISFPAEQANYFELENILKSIGFSDKSLYDIGGIIRLVSHWECDDILFLPISCKNKVYFDVLQYYGESVGFNTEKLVTDFPDFTSRTKMHYIGLTIVADTFGKIRT